MHKKPRRDNISSNEEPTHMTRRTIPLSSLVATTLLVSPLSLAATGRTPLTGSSALAITAHGTTRVLDVPSANSDLARPHNETSNFAGYTFSDDPETTAASFTVPTLRCSSALQSAQIWADIQATGGAVAEWALDLTCNGGTPSYSGDFNAASTQFWSFSPEAGDVLDTSITYAGTGAVTMSVTDVTRDETSSYDGSLAAPSGTSGTFEIWFPSGSGPNFGTLNWSAVMVNGGTLAASKPDAFNEQSGTTTLIVTSAIGTSGTSFSNVDVAQGACSVGPPSVGATPVALLPPSCLKPASATTTELDDFGIPSEPSSSDPVGRSLWLKMVDNMHWIPAKDDVNARCKGACGTFSLEKVNETTWAGYAVGVKALNSFHHAQGIFTEPKLGKCSCDPNDAAAFWIGIQSMSGIPKGGGQPMGQQGVQIGDNHNEGLSSGEAWFETDYGKVYGLNLYGTAGKELYLATSYSNGTYIYFFYNFANGDAESWAARGSAYSGQFADYIVEKNTQGLSNFGTLSFDQATAAVQQYPIGDYASKPNNVAVLSRIYLHANGRDLAVPSTLGNGGSSFTVTWKHCS